MSGVPNQITRVNELLTELTGQPVDENDNKRRLTSIGIEHCRQRELEDGLLRCGVPSARLSCIREIRV